MASLPSNTSVSKDTQSVEYFTRGQRNLADNSFSKGGEMNAGPGQQFPYFSFINSLNSLRNILD